MPSAKKQIYNQMAKTKTYYFCRECGYQSASWLGRCPECGKFGTFDEEVVKVESGKRKVENGTLLSVPKRLDEVECGEVPRLSTRCGELDRVLGGGLVAGSLVLLGGEPGIGKSTLLLQSALAMSGERRAESGEWRVESGERRAVSGERRLRLLYVSGEESVEQIKMRADRLLESGEWRVESGERRVESGERRVESGVRRVESGEWRVESGERRVESGEQLPTANCQLPTTHSQLYLVSETVTQRVMEHVETVKPDVLVVDSIQTMTTEVLESPAGSVGQIRQCTTEFQHYAKSSGVPVLLVGHITKDGTLAGPKVMEHIVDAVLQFEGDRNYGYRTLRALKNRFGSTAEMGIFEMREGGLHEVTNPSELLLGHRDASLSGAAVSATLEGVRPLMVEVQSLVSSAVYGTPQRNANGFDLRRMNMLLAVLEKRCGFRLGVKDVFLNLAGGLRVSDPALDLAVACSILSSNVDMAISPRVCFAAELGLNGEVRPVSRVEQRIAEADRLGFERIFVSKYHRRELDARRYGIEIVSVGVIEDAFRALFA